MSVPTNNASSSAVNLDPIVKRRVYPRQIQLIKRQVSKHKKHSIVRVLQKVKTKVLKRFTKPRRI